MTEPDEAMLWARENLASRCDEDDDPKGAKLYRSGDLDDLIDLTPEAYRAGRAASAERIKALEEAIREATGVLDGFAGLTVDQWDDDVAESGIAAWMVIREALKTVVVSGLNRTLLKEADQ